MLVVILKSYNHGMLNIVSAINELLNGCNAVVRNISVIGHCVQTRARSALVTFVCVNVLGRNEFVLSMG